MQEREFTLDQALVEQQDVSRVLRNTYALLSIMPVTT